MSIPSHKYHIISLSLLFLGSIWIGGLVYYSPLSTIAQDEVPHLLISQHAWTQPSLIFNLWGRCANTIFYMPSAYFGLSSARIFSIIAIALTAFIYMRIACLLSLKYWWLLPLFMYSQPWFSDFAYATTVVPLSLLFSLSAYLMITKRWTIAAICIGILPLVRTECAIITILWSSYAFFRVCSRTAITAFIPPLLYYCLAGLFLYKSTTWGLSIFTGGNVDLYGKGTWYHFFPGLLASIGWPVLILSFIDLSYLFRSKAVTYVVLPTIVYVIIHVVIYHFGLFSSGGYTYFLMPLSFITGLLAIYGLEIIYTKLNNSIKLGIFTKSLLILVTALFFLKACLLIRPLPDNPEGMATKQGFFAYLIYVICRPRPADEEAVASQKAAEWINGHYTTSPNIIATHVWVYYFMSLPLPQDAHWPNVTPQNAKMIQAGSLFVWDKHYSERQGWKLDILDNPQNGWELKKDFDKVVRIYLKK